MIMNRRLFTMMLAALLLAACTQGGAATAPTNAPAQATTTSDAGTAPSETAAPAANAQRLVVMTHDSFAVSAEVIQAFEQENNVSVQILQSGDAGAAAAQSAARAKRIGHDAGLKFIYGADAHQNTLCFACNNTIINRTNGPAHIVGLNEGHCTRCGRAIEVRTSIFKR